VISILSKSKATRPGGASAAAADSSHGGGAGPGELDEVRSAPTDAPEQHGDAIDPTDTVAAIDFALCNDEPGTLSASNSAHPQSVWRRVLLYSLPPAVMMAAVAVGYLKWQEFSLRELEATRAESVRAATDLTVKMLSYRPDTVDKDLASACDQMTGAFRDSYAQLTRDVVIPGSKQKRISAVATVPAAASESVTHSRAVVLVFVNQSIVVGDDAPSSTTSSVKVTLSRVNNRWLINDFTPI